MVAGVGRARQLLYSFTGEQAQGNRQSPNGVSGLCKAAEAL
jgi:hypothetical protein